MAKDELLKIRVETIDKLELEEVAKHEKVSASEFARVAIKNRVKKTKAKILKKI